MRLVLCWPASQVSLPTDCLFVSIVAVHGLDGHRDKTWTADNDVHWLRDLLPNTIPHARILCWGLRLPIPAVAPVSALSISTIMGELLYQICA